MIKSLLKSKGVQPQRDRIITYTIRILHEKKHEDIRAVIPDHPMPKKVVRESTGEGFIPEVTARKDGQYRIFAVETRETLGSEKIGLRWQLFEAYAKQHDALFFIVFPTGLVSSIKEKLNEFHVEARLWQASAD
jgi:hypothetical protein